MTENLRQYEYLFPAWALLEGKTVFKSTCESGILTIETTDGGKLEVKAKVFNGTPTLVFTPTYVKPPKQVTLP